MKRLLCLLIVSIVAIPGVAEKRKYDLEVYLDKVIREPQLVKEMKVENSDTYRDDLIVFTSVPDDRGIFFSIRNKTESSFKIIWGEIVYIDKNGESSYVMHWGTKIMEMEKNSSPTTVPHLSKVPDLIFPISSLPKSSIYKDRKVNYFIFERRYNQDFKAVSGWYNKVLFYYGRIHTSHFNKMVRMTPGWTNKKYAGELTLKVLLVIQHGDNEYNYQFFFKARPKNGEG